jgi:hypothetical protein
VALILDPSRAASGQMSGQMLEMTTRDLVFSPHNGKRVLLGYKSHYIMRKSRANFLHYYYYQDKCAVGG